MRLPTIPLLFLPLHVIFLQKIYNALTLCVSPFHEPTQILTALGNGIAVSNFSTPLT